VTPARLDPARDVTGRLIDALALASGIGDPQVETIWVE
jgi:hypothetical protein